MSQRELQYDGAINDWIARRCIDIAHDHGVYASRVWSRTNRPEVATARHTIIRFLEASLWVKDGCIFHSGEPRDNEALGRRPIAQTELGWLLGLDHSSISLALRPED